AGPVALPVEDLTALPAAQQTARVRQVLQDEGRTPFDLAHGPVLRLRLLRLGAEDHVFVPTLHHIVSDGWSQDVFRRELLAGYTAYRDGQPAPFPPLPVQYADFALWQRATVDAAVLAQGLAYWTQQLAGLPARLALPTDRPRPRRQTFGA